MSEVQSTDIGTGDISEIKSSISLDKDLKRFLANIINKVDGLYAVIITDRDGVPVIEISSESTIPSDAKSSFLSAVSLAIDQAGKIGLGKNKRIISIFSDYQVVHFNKYPLIITLIATSNANTGMLLNVGDELTPLTSRLATVVEAV